MEEIAQFAVSTDDDDRWSALFSPDGSSLVLKVANKVYLVPTATGVPAVLFEGTDRYSSISRMDDGSGIVVRATREMLRQPDDGSEIVAERVRERHYFGWDGAEAPGPAPACFGFPGQLSPDGRYTAELDGGPYGAKDAGVFPLDHPWPSVVIADAETCAPILRVRSARTHAFDWDAEWLSTSEGFVVNVLGGFAIARVLPEPALAPLPRSEPWLGPVPAPTGGGRYFGYGLRVYDAAEDRWRGPGQLLGGPLDDGRLEIESKSWWGDSHRERWFGYPVYTGGGGTSWLQLPPKIELPPFSDETAFRVARTGSCLRLREEPGKESRVLDCLPDGERLLFVERDGEPELYGLDALFQFQTPHPSISFTHGYTPWAAWVRVRTADGAEGWVSDDYLDYD